MPLNSIYFSYAYRLLIIILWVYLYYEGKLTEDLFVIFLIVFLCIYVLSSVLIMLELLHFYYLRYFKKDTWWKLIANLISENIEGSKVINIIGLRKAEDLTFYDVENNMEFINRLLDVLGIIDNGILNRQNSGKLKYYVSEKFLNYNKRNHELLNITYKYKFYRVYEKLDSEVLGDKFSNEYFFIKVWIIE